MSKHCPACGVTLDDKPNKPRSIDQHRRFFAIVRAVYQHWPDSHDVQFSTETECRKWLTMKAGAREVALRMPLVGIKPTTAVLIATAAMKAAGAHAVAVEHKGELVVFKPQSIRFDRMGHQEFCKLNDDVQAVIESETNLRVDDLLKETEAAA